MLLRRGVTTCLAILIVSTAFLAASVEPGRAAEPAWPVSSGMLISEVVTGGISASDEFVEIYDAAAVPLDLGGLELVYVSATGATVTRKATLPSVALEPGAHFLVANSAGAYAALADATYTGGLASDGGTLMVRTASGSVVDSISWGAAASSYVEGSPAQAPPARSSIERLPGGTEGGWRDTNDNAADFRLLSSPNPQNLRSPATPRRAGPTAAPSIEATEQPTETPDQPIETPDLEGSLEPEPTESSTAPAAEPTSTSSPEPSTTSPAEPSETAAEPSLGPSIEPTGSIASSPPTAAPTPTSSPSDPSDLISVAAARSRPIGARVHVAAVVTGQPGVLGTDDLVALGDSSGGIFARVPLPLDARAGRSMELIGTLAAPYGQLEIRELDWLALGAMGDDPVAHDVSLSEVGEGLEGSLVTVTGTIDTVGMDGERLWVTIGDGTTSVRLAADPASGISKSDTVRGQRIAATGIVGQRASATGRLDGYRVWLRMPSDLVAIADATPTPAGPELASASPTPASGGAFHDLAGGLARLGRSVDVEAVVTAGTGVIDWGGPTIVVDDGTAAAAVVLPAGSASPRPGERVHVRGKVGSLHSGRRVVATFLESLGDGTLSQPEVVQAALGPALEWHLVQVCGHIVRLTRAGARWRVDLRVGQTQLAVLGEPGAKIPATGLVAGRLALFRGIVRRSTSDPTAFLVLPRSPADISLGPAPASGETTADDANAILPQALGSGVAGDAFPMTAIADLAAHDGQGVTIAGLVVDTDQDTATLDDGTGSVRLSGTSAGESLSLLEIGDAVEVGGEVRRADAGWQIEVDPERILSLAGTPADASTPASLTALGQGVAASERPTAPDSLAAAGQGLARPRGESDGWFIAAQIAALLVVVLGLVGLIGLVALAWNRAGRPRRLGIGSVRTRAGSRLRMRAGAPGSAPEAK